LSYVRIHSVLHTLQVSRLHAGNVLSGILMVFARTPRLPLYALSLTRLFASRAPLKHVNVIHRERS
jgi:hypothetical protein